MRYRDAKKLQNGDEVIRKSDNSSLRVVNIRAKDKTILIEVVDEYNLLHEVTHTNVK